MSANSSCSSKGEIAFKIGHEDHRYGHEHAFDAARVFAPEWKRWLARHGTEAVVLITLVALAAAVRYPLLTHASGDFEGFTQNWYEEIRRKGAAALTGEVSNYAPIYMLLLYLVHTIAPQLPSVIAVKVPSLCCDLMSATFAYLIIERLRPQGTRGAFAFAAILLAPTVVLNSAYWGQADSIYTAALMGCLYFALRRHATATFILFGVAFSFKAQATFLAPLLLILVLKGHFDWRRMLWIPVAYLTALIPAAAAGRPIRDLLEIYVKQAGTYRHLSMNAPTAYTWLSDSSYELFARAGMAWAAAVVACLLLAVIRCRAKITNDRIVQLALACAIVVPFSLPKMHERYFYPADSLSIVYGALYPEMAAVPVAMTVISLLAYGPFLFAEHFAPMHWLAGGVLVLAFVVVRRLAGELAADAPREGAGPGASTTPSS